MSQMLWAIANFAAAAFLVYDYCERGDSISIGIAVFNFGIALICLAQYIKRG